MLKKLMLTILAILVIFEEWLWDMLTVAGQWLARAFNLERFDERLMKASPPQALLALFIPLAIVTPINIFALFLLAHGRIGEGILLEIVAKLIGTLLVARVFKLVRPALLTFAWFAKLYDAITGMLRWAHKLVHDSAIYKLSVMVKAAVKARAKAFLQYFYH
ncbi:MAG: hypothetical protein WAW36_16790 [Methylovulum miyakonense]|uniref:hypothetical protein n=1 Tax=Methylovulum miyakonense TaxID=645578 RepID=UPI003BB78E92